jgi:hypothetical protein
LSNSTPQETQLSEEEHERYQQALLHTLEHPEGAAAKEQQQNDGLGLVTQMLDGFSTLNEMIRGESGNYSKPLTKEEQAAEEREREKRAKLRAWNQSQIDKIK